MSEWKDTKLKEVLEFGNGKVKPLNDGFIPIYGGNGILGFGDDFNYSGETIIIGRVGAYCGSVFFENSPIWISDNALSAKPKGKNNAKFLYYFLKNVDLNQWAGGSSHPLVTQSLLNSLEFLICLDSEIQKSIASILSSLDDKIDLLHRQNATLEKMAETLFRQWFVEEAKEDWETVKIGDIAKNIQYGFTQSANFETVGPKFLRITDIQGGNVNWKSVPFCLANKSEFLKYQLKTGDIVVARTGASTGENLYIYKPDNVVFASYLVRIQFSELSTARYVAQHMRSSNYFDYIEGILSGSAQPNANANELTSYELALPSKDKLESFYKIVTNWDEKKHINQTQIRTLTTLRDTLLPKLMSGEVRVEM